MNLNPGGAEWMLARLLDTWDRERFRGTVVALQYSGQVGEHIETTGTPIIELGMSATVPNPRALWRLADLLRARGADVVQSWTYYADLLGGLAARWAGHLPSVWGVHHSEVDSASMRRRTMWTARTCALLSRRIPKTIVCCSEASRRAHAQLGYDTNKMVVIPNGFDTNQFKPNPEARSDVRKELGLRPDTPLLAMIARWAPAKDHLTFLDAAARVTKTVDAHLVLCGRGVDGTNATLKKAIEDLGLSDRSHLLGERRDVSRIIAGSDVIVSSSISEAFPLILGEAMACEVPVVATDVGDSAEIVGDHGEIVPPRDPERLASAVQRILRLPPTEREQLGKSARATVLDRFELSSVVRQYEDLYRRVAGGEI